MQHTTKADGVAHTVDAIEPVPGLRIYKHPTIDYGIGTYPVVLGHHSGLRIARLEYTAEAIDAANALAAMADWTRPADDLQADHALGQKVCDLVANRNAIWCGGAR
jgi:hypothetical protein